MASQETIADIAYATSSGAQKLDLHRSRDSTAVLPLIVDIHGGAFMFGDKTMDREQIAELVDAGYAVAGLDYRVSGEASFPAAVLDVKAAVRFLCAHAAKFGIDPERIGADRFHPHDAADSPESRWLGAPIQTIPDRVREASPLAYLDDADPVPPFHLAHGDRDDKVPGEQTTQLADALARHGAVVTHRVVAGAGHGREFPAADELPYVIAFFDRHLR